MDSGDDYFEIEYHRRREIYIMYKKAFVNCAPTMLKIRYTVKKFLKKFKKKY